MRPLLMDTTGYCSFYKQLREVANVALLGGRRQFGVQRFLLEKWLQCTLLYAAYFTFQGDSQK